MNTKYWKPEDLIALILGLGIVGLALAAAWGVDLLGWSAGVQVWIDPAKLAKPIGTAGSLGQWGRLA